MKALSQLLSLALACFTLGEVSGSPIESGTMSFSAFEVVILKMRNIDLIDAKNQIQSFNKALEEAGMTPFHAAATEGVLDAIKELLSLNVHIDINAKERGCESTALHLAARKGHSEIVELLLSNGAERDAVDAAGLTSLHCATIAGWVDAINVLLRNGAGKNVSRNGLRLNLSEYDVDSEKLEVYEELRSNACSEDYEGGVTALHVVAALKNDYIANMLLEGGIVKDAKDKDGLTALHYAACTSGTRVVQELLVAGADKDARDNLGWTALYHAVFWNRPEIVRVLLESGANPSTKGQYGWTPLHVAAKDGNMHIAEMFLKYGAWTNAQDDNGNTPLDCQDGEGQTLLHHAAKHGHFLIVKELLLTHGADPNAQDSQGQTPLHLAAQNKHPRVISALLRGGANKAIEDNQGHVSLYYAEKAGHSEAISLLT